MLCSLAFSFSSMLLALEHSLICCWLSHWFPSRANTPEDGGGSCLDFVLRLQFMYDQHVHLNLGAENHFWVPLRIQHFKQIIAVSNRNNNPVSNSGSIEGSVEACSSEVANYFNWNKTLFFWFITLSCICINSNIFIHGYEYFLESICYFDMEAFRDIIFAEKCNRFCVLPGMNRSVSTLTSFRMQQSPFSIF